jgi:DNA polymerase-3 subunit chi
MPRIDLYLLNEANFSEQIAFCCRLTEKASDKHSRIHIQTIDSLQAEALDTALWSFKPESFIAHNIGQSFPSAQIPPVIIDTAPLIPEFQTKDSLLILLQKELPEQFEQFNRLCLIIPNIEVEIQDARNLYKELKSRGHEVHIHDLRKS